MTNAPPASINLLAMVWSAKPEPANHRLIERKQVKGAAAGEAAAWGASAREAAGRENLCSD